MTRAEIIARLRAGETGYVIEAAISDLLHPGEMTQAYTRSVDAALAAPIAEGWMLEEMELLDDGWYVTLVRRSTHDEECERAPTLAAAIMAAKLLTFEVE